jgi:hypothetical protein
MTTNGFHMGDWVIYRKTKFSTHPGPRAENVNPARYGDDYSYTVDKFWVVIAVRDDGRLLLRTRRGKEHVVKPDDPNLRKANWWERWRYKDRFNWADTMAGGEPLRAENSSATGSV